jgi:cytochrome c2
MNRIRPSVTLMLLGLGALTFGGCTWGFGGEDVSEMHQRFSRTFDIQTGLARGDLDRARMAAQWIASRPPQTDLPAQAEASQRKLMEQAVNIAQAPDMAAAAASTGQMAAACGDCHQAMKAGPRFVVGQASPGGDSQEAQMIRHLWAADRMWEGLVGPSVEAWEAGATALAQTKSDLADVLRASSGTTPPAEVVDAITLVAGRAQVASTAADRAQVYGRMLETCNGCHQAAGFLVQMN